MLKNKPETGLGDSESLISKGKTGDKYTLLLLVK
jgi:hypothetical protein